MNNDIESRMRIVLLPGAHNPARKGTSRHARINAAMRAKTVEQALKKGARRTTLRYLRERRVLRLVK